MKINIPEIEQKIYYNICSNFANWCEMQLQQYESLLKFLDSITLETMCNTPSPKFYQMYVDFCEKHSYEALTRMLFAKMLSSFGYTSQKGYIDSVRADFYRPVQR
jgi:hypothetical protein